VAEYKRLNAARMDRIRLRIPGARIAGSLVELAQRISVIEGTNLDSNRFDPPSVPSHQTSNPIVSMSCESLESYGKTVMRTQ
jgi:hypothetical protein